MATLNAMMMQHGQERSTASSDKEPQTNHIELLKPILTRLISMLNYQGKPQIEKDRVTAVLSDIGRRAIASGLPLDTSVSIKAFKISFTLGVVCYPNHPYAVQSYITAMTWFIAQLEDSANELVPEALMFQSRFMNGEPQPNAVFRGLAEIIREAHVHFEDVVANMIQLSILKFITGNLIERREIFPDMNAPAARGAKFPYYLRDLSGLGIAYAAFCFPKSQYPDLGVYLGALPDMDWFINIYNDVISFYKEELAGETNNYIHNTASSSGKSPLAVVEEATTETLAIAHRVTQMLAVNELYMQCWLDFMRGYTALHTMNPRYKLVDMGLGEEHTLTPFQDQLAVLFAPNVKGNCVV